MGKPGRKSNWDKKAGNRLKIALDILSKNPETALLEVHNNEEWLALKLPLHPRTIERWFETGIPDEKGKIAKVAAFLKIPVDIFLYSTEIKFADSIKIAWGINRHERRDDTSLLPSCAQPNCLCENTVKIAQCITRVGSKWREAGMPYSLVMKYGESIYLHTQVDEVFNSVYDEAGLALGLIVSVHYGSGWEKWTSLNFSSSLAIEALLLNFRQHYWRVRFRTLYALQHVDPEILKNLLKEHECFLNEQTMIAIREHVYSKTVTRYFRHVAETSIDPNIRKKVLLVLSEISAPWKDASADGISFRY